MAVFELYPDWESRLEPDILADLERRAYAVENKAKLLLSMHGTGRVYTQHVFTRIKGAAPGTPGRLGFWGSRPAHQASSPGMPSSPDTGLYRMSIRHAMGADGEGPYADIGSDLKISLYLELGTRYMAARPSLRPALEAAAD